jgi:hypothetical protein
MSVNCWPSPPLRLSSQTCEPFFFWSSSPRDARNARKRPSGLQRGALSLASMPAVMRMRSVPSQLTIQMCVSRLSFSTSTVPTE